MNYLKQNPVGLDAVVHHVQNKLLKLNTVFNMEFDSYPKCYVNPKDKGNDFEYYVKKDEYRSVLHAERSKFFFIHDSDLKPVDTFGFSTNLKLYFIIDLSKINANQRNEAKFISEVDKIIRSCKYVELDNVDDKFESIFRNTVYITETDVAHPYYAVCFELKVIRYELNLTPCTNG